MKQYSGRYLQFLAFALVVLFVLIAPLSMLKRFSHDEFEHIHAAWYIAEGYLPFSDFFQNHNPLIWYLIIPVLKVFGYTVTSILAVRVLIFAVTVGSVVLTYHIAWRATGSKEIGLLSTVLLSSVLLFIEPALEIRPDVPQVFFGLLSIYFLVCFLQTSSRRHIVLCSLSLSLSFLFLEKAVFLVALVFLVLLGHLIIQRGSIRSLFYYSLFFCIPLLFFLIYLLRYGLLEDYIVTNWLVNMNRILKFSPAYILKDYLKPDIIFYGLCVLSVLYIMTAKKIRGEIRVIVLMGALLFSSLFLVSRPHAQNFMQFIPLFCIAVSVMLHRIFSRFALKNRTIIALVCLLLAHQIYYLQDPYSDGNRKQLEAVAYVLKNTGPADRVYDGNIKFNVFRPDLHYFWYSVNEGKLLDSYNLVTNNRYGDYDIYALIDALKPKFSSDFEIDPSRKEFAAHYEKTPYQHIYRRKEAGASADNHQDRAGG